MTERGLILLLGVSGLGTHGLRLGFDPTDLAATLRRSITYWDKIASPLSNVLHIEVPGQDWAELGSAGRARYIDVKQPGDHFSINGAAALADQIAALRLLQGNEPSQWSIAQIAGAVAIPESAAVHSDLLEIELHRCLPVPDLDVPIGSILEFKEKRRSELYAFRAHMDELRGRILSAGDSGREKRSALDHLDKAIADIFKAMTESFATRVLRSMVTLTPVTLVAAGGILSTPAHPLIAAVVCGAGAALTIRAAKGKKPIGTPDAEPFAYLQSVVSLDVRHK